METATSDTTADPLLNDKQVPSETAIASTQSQQDVSNSSRSQSSPLSGIEDVLRTGAMLGMVGFGLVVILLIFTWPFILLLCWPKVLPLSSSWHSYRFLLGVAVETLHVVALIFVEMYLFLHRKLCLPIRIPLMPLLNFTIRSEAIREREVTWYNDCKRFPKPNAAPAIEPDQPCSLVDPTSLLQNLSRSSRKDTKQKLRLYQQQGITSETTHSDYLSLRRDIPILWNHERRCCQKDGNSAVGEFVKRFLVLFLVPHAYLDRYHYVRDDGDDNSSTTCCCALGMFVVCDKVLMNSMYFCKDDACQFEIWQYHSIRGFLRAAAACHAQSSHGDQPLSSIEYINYFQHQDYAKRLVGAMPADDANRELMTALFPFQFYS